jgi:DNA invertase Pin-like site-specific DNA recombinase
LADFTAPRGDFVTLASKNSSVVGHDLDQDQDGPLPRRTRQLRRAKADRGLPPDAELTTLAADYCDHQAKLWPQLAKRGLLPSVSPETLAAMVVDFKERHRTGRVDPRIVPGFPKLCPKFGGSYNRYSCDNSSPTSINDQLVNSLRKACEEKRFVPWSYVFCDYSVSGLDSSRQGYASYKGILRDPEHMIETTYIDDFTRASRDEVEWWRLARLSKRLRKRMIGASDGFDLNSPDWDVKITIYGLVSRLFLKGLREKSKRGMRGAARRGTCIGRPPLGLTRRLCRDNNGNVVVGRDGKAKHVPCIDPASKDHALLVFELDTQKKWSRCRIARHFNEQRIEGSDHWTAQSIRYILSNPAYVGVFIWNQYRTEYDSEEERWTRIRNPRSEWEIYIDKTLALIPLNVWKQARRRIGLSRRTNPKTGKKASRNQNSATTLFSGTLFCGYCGEELTLYRSDGKYKLMGCKNGPGRRCECKLTTSKSTRIIEGALLKYIVDAILTDANLADFVGKVNSMLEAEAHRPRRDVNPLNARVAKLQKKNRNLLATIGDEDDADVRQAYHQEVKKNRKRITELTTEIERAGRGLADPPKPLTVDSLQGLLAGIRDACNQEIPATAEAIRALTGPISIREEKQPGRKRGGRWIATFTPDLVRFLARRAGVANYPDSVTLDHLSTQKWITSEPVEVAIDFVPKYKAIAAKVAEMSVKGASPLTIARALGTTREAVQAALEFVSSGADPTSYAGSNLQRWRGTRRPPKYAAMADEVAELREKQGMSFEAIAKKLGTSIETVTHAHDLRHSQAVADAAENGATPSRGNPRHLSEEARKSIRAQLIAGRKRREIASDVGCSISSIGQAARSMKHR